MNSMEQMYQAALRLPDQRLLAILHGQDNALPEAVAEAALRMRKRMQQGAMAQQAQAQQGEPTQKDKLLAEYGGIAGLPAELDMTGQAQQGVASFAFGGAVKGYSGQDGDSEVRVGPYGYETDPAKMSPMDRNFYGRRDLTGDPVLEDAKAQRLAEVRAEVERRAESMRRRLTGNVVDPVTKAIGPTTKANRPGGEFDYVPDNVQPTVDPSKQSVIDDIRAAAQRGGRSSSASEKGGIGALVARPAPPGERAAPVYERGPMAPTPTSNADTIRNAQDFLAATGVERPQEAKTYIDEHRALLKQYGVNTDPYAKLRDRLEKADAREEQDRRTNVNESLLRAGLGMLGGRSQYANVNIARGATEGLDAYQAGRKEIDRASMERAKALADIEKANSDMLRGDINAGLAKHDKAEARYDAALKSSFEIAQRSDEARDRFAATIFGTESQATSARNSEIGGNYRTLVQADSQRYATDSQYAAHINAAMISADATRAAAALRQPQDKVEKVLALAQEMVMKKYGQLGKAVGVDTIMRETQEMFIAMWPAYSKPDEFASQDPTKLGIGSFGKAPPGAVVPAGKN